MFSHSFSSSCVFHMLSFLLHFPPTFFPLAMTAFSYNEKWHIVKVLCFPTSSHTHSELGAKCSWCAASWTSLSAAKLAPSHACTPGMHSHSTGFLSATSYVAGLLFLSGTGPSNYKSNYLHKLPLEPRGRNSIYQNTPLSGENGKNLYCIKTYVLLSYIYHGSLTCLRQQHHCFVHSFGWVGMRFHCICIFFQLEEIIWGSHIISSC